MQSTRNDASLGRFASGCVVGGAVGGALVGLAEVILILATSAAPNEYWLVPYAIIAYGLLGLIAGVGGALAAAVIGRARATSAAGLALGVGMAVAPLAFIVGRYHVIQRVFHEELVLKSAMGVGVHVALLIGAALVAAAAISLLRGLQGNLALGGVLGVLALLLAASVGFAAATDRPESDVAVTTPSATGKGPNVILIVTDTLRADALSCLGGKPGQTPALDAFAHDGVLFEQAHSQASWTRPSIATLLTSLYPSVHGAVHKMDMLPDRVTTLAEAFSQAGYWTTGVVTNINVAPIFNFQQGFGEYDYLEPDFYFWATDSATRLAIYKGLREARERIGANRIYFYNYYQDAQIVENTLEKWLDRKPPQPFFLFIHYMDPHDPYFEIPYDGRGNARANNQWPPASLRDEMHRRYLQDASYLDGYLGQLFDRLRARGLYDNTVIALVADHGEEFQEHQGWWHGTTLYEEDVHVPLIIKRAHEPTPGARRTDLVRVLDVAPTLLAAAGARVPEAFMGRDLFTDAGSGEPLFAEEDLEGNLLASIRIGSWKLITANQDNPRGLQPLELYDLSNDPHEKNNRAKSDPERLNSMLQELEWARNRIAAGQPLRRAEADPGAADRRS